VTCARATIGLLVVAAVLRADPPAADVRAGGTPDFFTALGLTRQPDPTTDLWHIADPPAPHWMTGAVPVPGSPAPPAFNAADPFQQLLDRMGDSGDRSRPAQPANPGLIVDPGRWRFKQEMTGDLFKRTTKLEVPDPQETAVPYGGKNWKAQEKVQIPVPISIPLAEQLFVYGQFDGSGDNVTRQQTSISSKSGVGVKWALIAGSELQVRYATLTSYDATAPGRVQPALEVLAKMPLMGPLSLEYTGSAIPAVARTDLDQFKQELRLAFPLKGDNELEFGARYRWDVTPTPTPWVDRAEIFFGVKFRH
jgi:hypothetical protein